LIDAVSSQASAPADGAKQGLPGGQERGEKHLKEPAAERIWRKPKCGQPWTSFRNSSKFVLKRTRERLRKGNWKSALTEMEQRASKTPNPHVIH